MHSVDRYCEWLARQFFAPGLEPADLAQEARIGVWKARRDFDPSRGDWEHFAMLAAKRSVIAAVRAATRGKHGVLSRARSYHEPIGDEDGSTLADCLAAPVDIAFEYEQRERVRGLFGRLSGLEADVVRNRIAGDDYPRISAELKVDEKAVDNALQRVRCKAQAILDSYDRLAA
jgi:RNA polymerase sporulation-specific sigma factor